MELSIREVPSGDLSLHSLLDSAEHRNTITIVTRYGKPVAVVVPVGWYESHQVMGEAL